MEAYTDVVKSGNPRSGWWSNSEAGSLLREHIATTNPHQLELFTERAPRKPWCGVRKRNDHILPLDLALGFAYIQPNPPFQTAFLVFDIDRDRQAPLDRIHMNPTANAAFAWQDADLPEPTWTAVNRNNGNAHIAYALESPVLSSHQTQAALKFAACIERDYRTRLDADNGFTGGLTKNPFNPLHHVIWGRSAPYCLDELREYLPAKFGPTVRLKQEAGMGRNQTLFAAVSKFANRRFRTWTGTREAFDEFVRSHAEELNSQFGDPLSNNEVKHLARGCARWPWKNINPAEFSGLQASRARLKGDRFHAELLESLGL